MNWFDIFNQLNYNIDDNLLSNQISQLEHYLILLERWNKVYNLTAVRNLRDMLPLHIYDSLAILPYIKGKTILDVGSGAGLPGIPLAIMRPDLEVVMLDANGKKTRFIQQAMIELKLTNTTVVHSRIEQLKETYLFDAIISRAFSSMNEFVTLTDRYLADGGCFYAMKGQLKRDELNQLSKRYIMDKTISLNVPEIAAERHLIIIKRG